MRNRILILLVTGCFTLCTGCNREEINLMKAAAASEKVSAIVGIWELRRESGGWSGPKTYPAANGTTYKFTANRYEFYNHGQLIKKGEYKIIQDTVRVLRAVKDKIIFDQEGEAGRIYIAKLTDQELVLAVDAYDAPTTVYERIKD